MPYAQSRGATHAAAVMDRQSGNSSKQQNLSKKLTADSTQEVKL